MNMLGYIVTEQHISAYFHVQQVAGQVVICTQACTCTSTTGGF